MSGLIGYETTFIVSPETGEDIQKTFLEKVKTIISNHSGSVVAVEDWGKRKFAYPINGEVRGYYHHIAFAGDNKLVAELERNMRINESVLRFLTVKLDTDFNAAEYKRRPSTNLASERPVIGPGTEHRYAERNQFEGGEHS